MGGEKSGGLTEHLLGAKSLLTLDSVSPCICTMDRREGGGNKGIARGCSSQEQRKSREAVPQRENMLATRVKI